MPGNFYTVTFNDIATWPTPNYTNPVARTWLPAYAIFWEVLTTLFVAGRLYLRLRNRSGPFGLDDVFIFVAWCFSVAFTATACIGVWTYGIGRHIWDVLPSNYEGALYLAWVAQVMFIFSTGGTKLSVLLFYRRMAKSYGKRWLITVWVLIFITIASWISVFITYCFICTPLSTYWNIHEILAAADTNYQCLNGDAITIYAGILTIASDFWTAALPCAMFQYHDLGVSKRQKIALNIIFCLGFLVTGIGIARTYYLWQMGQNQDLSWIGFDLFVTSVAESQFAIILTCAPFLRALFRRYFPNFTHISRSRGTDNTVTNNRVSHGTMDWSRIRGTSFQPTKPLYTGKEDEIGLEVREEKKGHLVHEHGTNRLVWSERSSSSTHQEPPAIVPASREGFI